MWKLSSRGALLLAATMLCVMPMQRAEAESKTEGVSAPAGTLEEIFVTARKREETQQSVPLAIGVLSENVLRQQNFTRLESVGKLLPNVGVEATPGTGTSAAISLRGISVYDFELYIDPPVAVYVDGVYYSRPQMLNFDNLFDLERVEVLYGPQGTLFGRNTTGGAVSVTTQSPREDFGARATLGYGSDNEFIGRALVNTGIIGDTGLKAKLIYGHREMDGWQRNLNTDDSHSGGANTSDYVAVHVSGEWAERFQLDYRFDHTNVDYHVGGNQIVDATSDVAAYYGRSPSLGGQPFIVSRDRLSSVYQNNAQPASNDRIWGHSLTGLYEHSDALRLKNILAYRNLSVDEVNNGGAQGFLRGELLDPVTYMPIGVGEVTPFSTPVLHDQAWQFSEEFQATGEVDRWTYAAGLFYFQESSDGNNLNKFTFVLPGGAAGLNLSTQRKYELDTKSYAAYAQTSYRPAKFEDRLELTAGLRYTVDNKELQESLFSLGFPAGAQQLHDDWDNLSENLSISYQATDDVLFYARFATAYKAGGYNAGSLQRAYGPEEAEVYEIGLKSDLLDDRLRLNAAIFYTVYDHIQVNLLEITETSNSTVLTNAASADYAGGELMMTFVPVRGLQLIGNIGYVDPEYNWFDYRDPVSQDLIDVAHEARSPLTSKLTYNLAVQYEWGELPVGKLSARVDYAYRDHRYYFPLDRMNMRNKLVRGDEERSLRAYITLSEINAGSTELSLELWGDNLLDRDQRISGIDFGGLGFGTVNFVRPRSFGVSLTAEL